MALEVGSSNLLTYPRIYREEGIVMKTSTFKCPNCGHIWQQSVWKWLLTTVFHWFDFSDLRDYRKTKCPNCGEKHYIAREK